MFTLPRQAGEFRDGTGSSKEFASRAYRRPVTEAELGKLIKLVDLADAERRHFERGIQLAVQAALVSPQFLFRVELDSRGKVASRIGGAGGGRVDRRL